MLEVKPLIGVGSELPTPWTLDEFKWTEWKSERQESHRGSPGGTAWRSNRTRQHTHPPLSVYLSVQIQGLWHGWYRPGRTIDKFKVQRAPLPWWNIAPGCLNVVVSPPWCYARRAQIPWEIAWLRLCFVVFTLFLIMSSVASACKGVYFDILPFHLRGRMEYSISQPVSHSVTVNVAPMRSLDCSYRGDR